MVDVRSLSIREEAINLRYEPAVDLADVVRKEAPHFMQSPVEFFERTHLTENMRALVIKALMNLLGLRKATVGGRQYEVMSNLILLPSDFGGGKTHTLILLYHIVSLVAESSDREVAIKKLKVLDRDIADFVSNYWDELKSISSKVVVIDCKYSEFAPGPAKPIRIAGKEIRTLWGYLGIELGKYDQVEYADEKETAPYADDIYKMLNDSGALILIDEIGRYYDQSGLEPSKISAFLMNLAEAMSKHTVSRVAVVLSVPYEVKGGERVEAKKGMEYVHASELIDAVNEVLSRPNVEIIRPVEKGDLADILRKRIFSNSREEFLELAREYVAEKVSEEYPSQVRSVLDTKGFWKEVERTYPFHPLFLDLLEKLAYRLPYLQRTRDAIKITVQTVLAIRDGLFESIDEEIDLISPYHIPIFLNEVLSETILRNAPDEYKVFRLILSANVFEPQNYEMVRGLGPEEFFETVVASSLKESELKEDDLRLGIKLAAIIWLHSLIGLGLPMNMGDYPTTSDLIFSVSPTELDVKGILGILSSMLPQLIVHGDPESDTARWFFARVPSIEELIEMLKKNVTDEMAKSKLAQFIEEGLEGRRGRGRLPKGFKKESIFKETKVARSAKEVPEEILSSRDPVIVAFADIVDKENLIGILEGRNNVVALAPYVKGYDDPKKLPPEDIRGIRELAKLKGATSWDGLLEILRYYVAAESVSSEHIKSFAFDKLGGESEEALMEDILKLLSSKVSSKKEYYYRHVWNMVNRCYTKVYYYRQEKLLSEEGLSLESDMPLAPIVESFLRDKGLIPDEFGKEDIIAIFKNYLGKNPEEDEISVGSLWNFIRTTKNANVSIISWKMFIEGIKDLVKSLDYAVLVDGTIFWKPVFNSLEEAEREEEGKLLLRSVNERLRTLRKSWDDVRLVYWKKVFDEWLKSELERTPKNKVLKVKDRSGQVYDVRDVKIEPEHTIKSGKLFYEERKYPVEVDVKLPEEIWEKRDYKVEATINVENFGGNVQVKIISDKGLMVEPTEFQGEPPLTATFKLRGVSAGNYTLRFEVYGNGELLESRAETVAVKGEYIEEEVVIGGEGKSVPEDARVVSISVNSLDAVPELIRVFKDHLGSLRGSITVTSDKGEVSILIKAETPEVLEMLWSSMNNLVRATGGSAEVEITYTPKGEPSLRDIKERLVRTGGIIAKIRRKAVG